MFPLALCACISPPSFAAFTFTFSSFLLLFCAQINGDPPVRRSFGLPLHYRSPFLSACGSPSASLYFDVYARGYTSALSPRPRLQLCSSAIFLFTPFGFVFLCFFLPFSPSPSLCTCRRPRIDPQSQRTAYYCRPRFLCVPLLWFISAPLSPRGDKFCLGLRLPRPFRHHRGLARLASWQLGLSIP